MFLSKKTPSFLAWSCVMLGLSNNLGAVLPDDTEARATPKATASANTELAYSGLGNKKTISLSTQKDLTKVELVSSDMDVQVLNLSDTNVCDLSNLPQYTRLEKLVLNGCSNPDLDLSVLSQCKALRFLDLSCMKGKLDLTFLKDCNIETLFIECRDELTDLKCLAGCTGIKSLYVSGRKLKTLDGIGGLAKLAKLQVSSNALTTLDGVELCQNLTTLRVFMSERLQDVHALQNHPSLKHATIDSFPGTNLEALKGCEKLESLKLLRCCYLKNLDGCEGESIQSIHIEKFITFEQIHKMPLQNIDAVATWPQLKTFYTKNTFVSDLSPLMQVPHLVNFYTCHGRQYQLDDIKAMVKERRRELDLDHTRAY